jgi:hypothetical protein
VRNVDLKNEDNKREERALNPNEPVAIIFMHHLANHLLDRKIAGIERAYPTDFFDRDFIFKLLNAVYQQGVQDVQKDLMELAFENTVDPMYTIQEAINESKTS